MTAQKEKEAARCARAERPDVFGVCDLEPGLDTGITGMWHYLFNLS